MKVSVSYGERTYGNAFASKATEIRVWGSQAKMHIDLGFKKPQQGRSWDWLSAGSVGGATMEMPLADAKALAQAILDFAEALPTYEPMKESMHAQVRLRESTKPRVKLVREPHKFL